MSDPENTPATPTPAPAVEALTPLQKVGLLQAVAQLDMLVSMFPNAPERVKKAGEEFRDSLKDWAANG